MKNYIKNQIKKRPFLLNNIKPVYKYLFSIPRKLGWYRAPRMLEGELNFFRHIYKQLSVIVDVGARYDIDYVEISKKNSIRYYLFEVNPKFYRKLNKRLLKFKEEIHVENFAVGERDGTTEYYEDSESVLQSTTGVKNSTMKLKETLHNPP